MSPIRRSATPAAPAAPQGARVKFMDLGLYAGGFTLPEGDYALDFQWAMEPTHEKMGNRLPRLGVLLTAYPLKGGDPQEQFLSAGGKARDSFAPDTTNGGKSLVAVPGGAGGSLQRSTNWMYFLKSLYDCGLPANLAQGDDFTAIDGVWVHTTNVPEPEERKGFGGSKTGEASMGGEEIKTSGTIPNVAAILDGGKPWEGTGGFPEAGAAPVAAPAPAPKPGPRAVTPASRTVAIPVAAPAAVEVDDAVLQSAVNGASSVLEKNPDGVTRLLMKTGTFKAVSQKDGDDMAQAVQNTFFVNDETLNGLLQQLGYGLSGPMVKPLAP